MGGTGLESISVTTCDRKDLVQPQKSSAADSGASLLLHLMEVWDRLAPVDRTEIESIAQRYPLTNS